MNGKLEMGEIMTNHTEGPWMAAAAPSSVVGWPIIGPQGRVIANVAWTPKPPHASDEEYAEFVATCKANANLIAASNDLLLAAERALRVFSSPHPFDLEREARNALKAAIAKATKS